MQYKLLNWDTEFFGFNVAKIIPSQIDKLELSRILSELKVKQVKLVYWSSDNEINSDYITSFGGILADKKTTFVCYFSKLDVDKFISTINVEQFREPMAIAGLEDLAIQSGEFSRFAIDPSFPREKFVLLYKIWINKSLQKEIASEVLVIRDREKNVGMVTLGEKKGRGDIGLLAVDSHYRGRSFGEKLIRASQKWFIKNGYNYGQVLTQGQNLSACNLYKKCGYIVDKIEYLYHFWI